MFHAPLARISNDFEWGVTAFAAGVAVYFILPFEPDFRLLAVVSLLLWVVHKIIARYDVQGRWIWPSLFFFCAVLGLTRGAWHSASVDAPTLADRAYWVTGWVEAVERSGRGMRWRIRVTDIEGYGDPPAPHRVRVVVRGGEANGGDSVRVRAVLSPLPGPVVPGGYDPGRKAFFDRIAASGYNISTPEIIPDLSLPPDEHAHRALTKLRYNMARRIRDAAPEETAGLQVALLTGVRSYIPPEQTEALRTAGLAHVLAISGLHMGLLSGGAFYLATFLLALIAPLSRRYDVRKPAAIIGALVATGYLGLSGASVATQRAFIMAIIVYLAVILDRRAFSMRSVAMAAIITLWLHPESLISAGFQMSFAAVAALVVVYQYWQGGRDGYAHGIIARARSGLTTLSITSLVAGAATGGYAIIHFGRMAKYGFIGNLLAMPIFSLFVMPAALATLIMMPFGGEDIPLRIMGGALSVVLYVAETVAGWPGALTHIKGAPPWIIGLYSAGFVVLILGRLRLRMVGLAVIALCFGIWAVQPRADMRVSDSGKVAFWDAQTDEVDTPALYVDTKRSDKYGRAQFVQRAGEADVLTQSYKDARALCDALACRFDIKGRWISIVNHPSEVPDACETADLVILGVRRAGPVANRNCKALLLDQRDFYTGGAHDIFVTETGINAVPAITQTRKARPWASRP